MRYESWGEFLETESTRAYCQDLANTIRDDITRGLRVYPPLEQRYKALELHSIRDTKIVILGQDPYHKAGQAHGLAFSYVGGGALPPSLVNIFKELYTDLNSSSPEPRQGMHAWFHRQTGDLTPWGRRGILLLNTALTVREGRPGSHLRWWRPFTLAALRAVVDSSRYRVHFVCWGQKARDCVLEALGPCDRRYPQTEPWLWVDSSDAGRWSMQHSAHPSPLSASSGFFGSKPFSRANIALRLQNPDQPDAQINWSLR